MSGTGRQAGKAASGAMAGSRRLQALRAYVKGQLRCVFPPWRLAAVLFLAAVLPCRLVAQSLREISSSRQYRGEPRLMARVNYTGGALALRPADGGTLYRMRLTYDEERYEPTDQFDAGSSELQLGLRSLPRAAVRVSSNPSTLQRATVLLSPRASLDLQIQLGAADAEVDLSGLRLARFSLENGASRTTLRMTTPNPIRCDIAELRSGAAELEAVGLGNARCSRVRFMGGVGRVTLDFSGSWSGLMQLQAEMAMGELVVRVPRGAGVRLKLDRFLASFAPAGLSRSADGTVWTSPQWNSAAEQLDVEIDTAVGGVSVEWLD